MLVSSDSMSDFKVDECESQFAVMYAGRYGPCVVTCCASAAASPESGYAFPLRRDRSVSRDSKPQISM